MFLSSFPLWQRLTSTSAGKDSDDLKDVPLLDSYDKGDNIVHNGTKQIQVRITGITCATCSKFVETAFNFVNDVVNDVVNASFALLQNKADVVFNPSLVKDEDIKNVIEDAGFVVEILPESGSAQGGGDTMVRQFTIEGMTCVACVNSVEGILRSLTTRAVVALATSLGEVEYVLMSLTKRIL